MANSLSIHTDGAARGNPGPAAYAFVITDQGVLITEEGGCLGRMTNNQAEYTALVRALQRAARLETKQPLIIHSDSELMVKQMRGEYRVKNAELRDLYEQASDLIAHFPAVTFKHVRREQNRRADQLCNDALDGRLPETSDTDCQEAPLPEQDGLTAQAMAILENAAREWAKGDVTTPNAANVWRQLRTLMETHAKSTDSR